MTEREQEPVNALDREFEVGDISVEGEVPESDPDLPAVDEDDLDEEPTEPLESTQSFGQPGEFLHMEEPLDG